MKTETLNYWRDVICDYRDGKLSKTEIYLNSYGSKRTDNNLESAIDPNVADDQHIQDLIIEFEFMLMESYNKNVNKNEHANKLSRTLDLIVNREQELLND